MNGCKESGNRLNKGGEKPVYVRTYKRVRHGRTEYVKVHYRSNWGSKR